MAAPKWRHVLDAGVSSGRTVHRNLSARPGPFYRNVKNSQCTRLAWWCSGYSPGLVIARSHVPLPAGALPASLGQLSLRGK